MKPSEMITLLKKPAQTIFTQQNLFASVNLAQLADETGWLSFLPHDMHTNQNSFNLYGIKGDGPAGSVHCYTQEYENNQWITIVAQFAAYHSYLESMQGRVDFLQKNPRYASVFKAKNPIEQAHALQDCGWATDPNYAQKLIEIMQENNLFALDKKIRQKPTRYNVKVGWFDSVQQADIAVKRIEKITGYHSIVEKA